MRTSPRTQRTTPPIANDRRAAAAFVAEWQGPVHDHALRMLGSEADAADATQEVLLRALANIAHDAPCCVRAWLFRIATNVVRDHLRSRRARREREERYARERIASRQDVAPDGSEAMERDDERAAVLEALGELPEEPRALIVLHYFTGLTQREMAHALDLPRTTIADRLRRSEALLRKRLDAGGFAYSAGGVAALLRSIEPTPPPAHLADVVLSQFEALGPSFVDISIGATIMSKTLPAIGVAIALAASFYTGRLSDDGELDAARRDAARLEEAATRERDTLASVARERDALRREVASRDERIAGFEREIERVRQDLRRATEAEAARTGASEVRSSDPADDEEREIPWAELAALMAEHRDLLLALGPIFARGDDPAMLSREDQFELQKIMRAWGEAGALARLTSRHPSVDPRILTGLLGAFFGGGLGLSQAELDRVVSTALDELGKFDLPDDATPLEAWRARTAVFERIASTLGEPGALPDDRRAAWETIAPVWDRFSEAGHRVVDLGIDDAKLEDRIAKELASHYGLTDEQRAAALEPIRRYLDEARPVAAKRPSGSHGGPEPEVRDALLDLQARLEGEILPQLAPEQWDAFAERPPLLLYFGPGQYVMNSDFGGPGF